MPDDDYERAGTPTANGCAMTSKTADGPRGGTTRLVERITNRAFNART